MHFTVSKNIILKSLHKVIGVIPAKTTIPILENVLLELQENKLQLTGTDLEICVSTELEVSGVENGSSTVPAKSLTEILRELPDVPIEFKLDENNRLHLKTDKGLYKLVSQPKDEFPSIVVEDSEGDVEIENSALLRMISKTIFAVSTDELRPSLMGVYFQFMEEELRCVVTDGHRLVKYIDYVHGTPNFQKNVIVPTKALNLILKSIDNSAEKDTKKEVKKVNLSVGENHIVFRFDDTFIYSKIIEGQYPKYENVIPLNNDKKLIVNRDELAASVKRVSIFSNLITRQIKLLVENNKITISSEDIEYGGEGNEAISAEYSEENMEIAYNAVYLLDILRHIDTEEVKILLKDSISAAIIYPTDQLENEEIMMLIMPIRINEE